MTRLTGARPSTYIAQGEFAVGDKPEHQISAILGSCVAVCLWDKRHRVGGMNHMLLPDGIGKDMRTRSMGAGAMETLINGILQAGGAKSCFEAKVFGGASVVAGLSDIGRQNVEFAIGFLQTEGIPVVGEDTKGTMARRLQFWPESGLARMKIAQASEAKTAPPPPPPSPSPANDLELF